MKAVTDAEKPPISTGTKSTSPRLADLAAKAVSGAKEALDDFVLEAPSDLLNRFDSALEAARSIVEPATKGEAKDGAASATNPRRLHADGLSAFNSGDFQGAITLWQQAEGLVPDGEARESIRWNIAKAQEKMGGQKAGKSVSDEATDAPPRKEKGGMAGTQALGG
jgi:Flp pilus assembly protein TadD